MVALIDIHNKKKSWTLGERVGRRVSISVGASKIGITASGLSSFASHSWVNESGL